MLLWWGLKARVRFHRRANEAVNMGLLDKLLRRNSEADHAQWVKDHPEKDMMPAPPVEDLVEKAKTRERMEKEVADQNAQRNQ